MQKYDTRLRDKIRLLGHALGRTIENHLGSHTLQTIEMIRQQAKLAQEGSSEQRLKLIQLLTDLPEDSLLPVVKGFNQFLNLSNLAELQHKISWRRDHHEQTNVEFDFSQFVSRLEQCDQPLSDLTQAIAHANIEVVLTAHPTEVTRRTLIQKYDQLTTLLQRSDDLSSEHPEQCDIQQQIHRLIEAIWHTDEIRQKRPSATDEAKWGFTVVEQSLWQALPQLLRSIDQILIAKGCTPLPIDAAPIRFASWMGGDRDGNPNVTASVTRNVLLLARWQAADLYLRDIDRLGAELSVTAATPEMQKYGDKEPYRVCLHRLRHRLSAMKLAIGQQLSDAKEDDLQLSKSSFQLVSAEEIRIELSRCHHSLMTCNMKEIANGPLLDTLRRTVCFGSSLVQLDVRQESTRHTDVIAALCDFYDYGAYRDWDEEQKQNFLLRELASSRPLIPAYWQPDKAVQEVLDTMAIFAEDLGDDIACYIISMASYPSDILAVALLLRASGVTRQVPIVPLFETLDDLENATECMSQLWAIEWYRQYCSGQQQVMIGYSDSAKDAGQLAAVWAQYRAQRSLTAAAQSQSIRLCLFHGRGGSVGRGGGPAHRGILAQPPGSVRDGFRVTEQGEMIRFKFGTPALAQHNLNVYLSAVLEAKLLPPPDAQPEWCDLMHTLTQKSSESYRHLVQHDVDFLHYFQAATPVAELGKLALGSRPARRRKEGGIQSLRAIPWIFAWTQMRLMVPSWLGADEAFEELIHQPEQLAVLRTMYQQWSFFTTYIDMLEMVLCKTDVTLSAFYEQQLVQQDLLQIGDQLRRRLAVITQQVLLIKQCDELIQDEIALQQSLKVRNIYTDPLHYLQVELLQRTRQSDSSVADNVLEQALKVTMAGIAAGMRNTG